MKKTILSLAAALVLSVSAFAEGSTMFNGSTNIQVFYDFAKDRQCVTTTLEGFYSDPWGNTFFFVDHDYAPIGSKLNPKDMPGLTKAISGTYWEIARCFNFWQNVPVLNAFSLQVEYNGGLLLGSSQNPIDGSYTGYGINHSLLAGIDYFIHSQDYRNTLNLKVLYKAILGATSKVPMQFTVVWGLQDLFGLQGLRFSGFADFWWQDQFLFPWANDPANGYRDYTKGENTAFTIISEPQLWYNVGQWFGVKNLNIGGEVELSLNFGTLKGFRVRPCLGAKWVF